jgi:hypothetical protein
MLMDEKKCKGIEPYRMVQIMKTASAITDVLVNGKYLFRPSLRECKIVIELVYEAIEKGESEYMEE